MLKKLKIFGGMVYLPVCVERFGLCRWVTSWTLPKNDTSNVCISKENQT